MLKRFKPGLFIVLVYALISCQTKEKEVDYNPDVLSAKDYVVAEDAVFEIVNAFFKGIHDTAVINEGYNYIDACSIYYYADGDSMTFGYGTVDRMCEDGKFRRGLYRVHFSGNVFDEGVVANIKTDSLFVDDSLYVAEMQITNEGLNMSNLQEYRLQVTSSSYILADTNKINPVRITTDFIMEWAEGYQTPQIHEDDLFNITGTAAGVSSNLYEFSIVIREPLANMLDCFWIQSGLSEITVPVATYPTGTIDYILSDGCFNEFHFVFNGNLFYQVIK